MTQPTFDKYASSYDAMHRQSIAASGYGPDYFDAYKIREIARWWKRNGAAAGPQRILNFGCGIGKSEAYFRAVFPKAEIFSCDVSENSLEEARTRNAGLDRVHFGQIRNGALPFAPAADLAFAANVFHHIPPPQREHSLRTVQEGMAPGGAFFLFEHNPWNPLTRKAVRDCPFDEDAILLSSVEARRRLGQAGFQHIQVRYRLFFPAPLKALVSLEPALGWLPLGAQYYCLGRK